jgi:hypothetical protein
VTPSEADPNPKNESGGTLHELRSLREENGRLKRIVADLTMDRQILCQKKRRSFAIGITGEVGARDESDFGEAFSASSGSGSE